MSTASYLLLFFLCISLHASYARHLNNIKLQQKSHFSIKLNEGPNKTETRLVGDSEKPRNRRSTTNHRVQQAVKNGSGALKKSLVSVSWRVPHNNNNNNNKKPRQKHPGFDLDYSPPKTHPPHHN
ncbi:hypothetical protein DEO72_LG8g1058 [Vigna unguiculata]|uniref:Uncharacterized protein n=2 Tax=Vigna unguiculata TaxID=3917 RepID=A0A4D6MNC8_VIGUN|nr:hypothetical protein DEO72_LG8g1058 [Vigna unguiculata]